MKWDAGNSKEVVGEGLWGWRKKGSGRSPRMRGRVHVEASDAIPARAGGVWGLGVPTSTRHRSEGGGVIPGRGGGSTMAVREGIFWFLVGDICHGR